MNKLISVTMISLVLLISGCATDTNNTSNTTAEQTMTFDEAMMRIAADDTWIPTDIETLKLQDEDSNLTIAHALMSTRDWVTEDPEILRLKVDNGISIAHMQVVLHKWQTQDKDILMLTDDNGVSVAVLLIVLTDWTTTNEDVLSLSISSEGETYTVKQLLEIRMEEEGF